MTEQELKDEKEQAVKRGGEIYADHYIEGLLDGRNLALRQFAVIKSVCDICDSTTDKPMYKLCDKHYAEYEKFKQTVL